MLVTAYKDEKGKEIIKDTITNNTLGLDFYFFKYSKIIDNAMINALSFTELYNETPLSKKAYKNFFDEYSKLLNTIKNKGRSNAKKRGLKV